MSALIPVARSLYVCESYAPFGDDKIDLFGLFNALYPQTYPFEQDRLCVFAQLCDALGDVPFFLDIRHASTDNHIYTTKTNRLFFPSRTTIVQMAMTITKCSFPKPGLYLVELYCDNQWICDTTLTLH